MTTMLENPCQVSSEYHDSIKAENDFVEHGEEFSFLASHSVTNI